MNAPDIEDILAALYELAFAEALRDVPGVVAGWNGPPDRPHRPHPPHIGAKIETTCGRYVKLNDAMTKARDVLARAKAAVEQA